MNREPAVLIGAAEGVIIAVLGLLVALNVIEASLEATIATFVAALVPVAGSLLVRSKVTPTG